MQKKGKRLRTAIIGLSIALAGLTGLTFHGLREPLKIERHAATPAQGNSERTQKIRKRNLRRALSLWAKSKAESEKAPKNATSQSATTEKHRTAFLETLKREIPARRYDCRLSSTHKDNLEMLEAIMTSADARLEKLVPDACRLMQEGAYYELGLALAHVRMAAMLNFPPIAAHIQSNPDSTYGDRKCVSRVFRAEGMFNTLHSLFRRELRERPWDSGKILAGMIENSPRTAINLLRIFIAYEFMNNTAEHQRTMPMMEQIYLGIEGEEGRKIFLHSFRKALTARHTRPDVLEDASQRTRIPAMEDILKRAAVRARLRERRTGRRK